MSELVPQVPRGWRVTGQLYDTEFPELLNEDMVELSNQPRNLLIHAGWEPEEDVQGHYVISVLQGCDIIEGPIAVSRMSDAAKKITDLAFKHSGSVSTEIWFNAADTGSVQNRAIRVRRASRAPRTILIEREYA